MPDELLANLIVFARALRAAGVAVRPEGVPDALRALDVVGVARKPDVRDALRAVLVSRRDDFVMFDDVFEQFWRVWPDTTHALPHPMHVPERARSRVRLTAPGVVAGASADRPASPSDEPAGVRTYS